MFMGKRGSRFDPCQVAADQLTVLYSEEGNFGLGKPTWLNGWLVRRSNEVLSQTQTIGAFDTLTPP
jgi:hypothetical protein